MANPNAMTPAAKDIQIHSGGLQLTTMQDAVEFGRLVVSSGLCPKSYNGKPEQVVIACQYGAELGMKPMQALQSIAVINGRPSLWGDGLLALVKSSAKCEYVHESYDEHTRTATCKAKRQGDPEETIRKFSWKDAELAKLTEKQPWRQYPQRMLQMRARSWCLRDAFADLLCGIQVAEEVQDYPVEGETTISSGDDVPLDGLDDVASQIETESVETNEPQEQELPF